MTTNNKYDVSGKVVLITGAGSGIGKAIATEFLQQHATVVLVGRREQILQETLDEVPNANGLVISGDISKAEDIKNIIATIENTYGKLDILIPAAAAFTSGQLQNTDSTTWENIRNTNIDSFFYLAKYSYPLLKESKGNIVSISSVSGLSGDWGQSLYNATKFAMNGFIKSLALDWGVDNIRVNAVAPAFTITDMTSDIAAQTEELPKFINRISLGRAGNPDDIVPIVLFLASDDAKYVTGSIYTVDGGTTASTGQPHL